MAVETETVGSNVDTTTVEETQDTSTSLVEGDESTGEGTDTQVDEGQGTETQGEEGGQQQATEDGRVIPQYIRGLKESNPEAYKQAKAQFFELRDRRETFPTSQAARDVKELVDSLGGQEGITEMRENANFLKEASHQFLTGDPKFIKDLANDDPIAFSLHFPTMLEEMQTRDFNYFADNISKLWDKELESTGVLRALQHVTTTLNKIPKGAERDEALYLVDQALKWGQSISNRAKKAEDPRVKAMLAERTKGFQEKSQSVMQEMDKDYKTKALNAVIPEGRKAFDSAVRDFKLSKEDSGKLFKRVVETANSAVMADKHFIKDRDALLTAKDVNGAIRLVKQRYNQEWAKAVKEEVRLFRLDASGRNQGRQQTGQQQQQQNRGQQQQRLTQGFARVNARPAAEDIDRSRTPADMIISGKAILRDGRKVDWSHLKRN